MSDWRPTDIEYTVRVHRDRQLRHTARWPGYPGDAAEHTGGTRITGTVVDFSVHRGASSRDAATAYPILVAARRVSSTLAGQHSSSGDASTLKRSNAVSRFIGGLEIGGAGICANRTAVRCFFVLDLCLHRSLRPSHTKIGQRIQSCISNRPAPSRPSNRLRESHIGAAARKIATGPYD